MSVFVENRYKWIVLAFFAGLFVLGIFIFRDYGMSWDEFHFREVGEMSMNYVLNGDTKLFESPLVRIYGPVFAIFLSFAEKVSGIQDLQAQYYLRHFFTFLLFFAGAFCFYRLCATRFKHRLWGVAGAAMLILSPRIFADSFYNPKDIPLFAVFIVSILALTRFLENKTASRAALLALASAVAIDMRFVALLIPAITILFVFADILFIPAERKAWKKKLAALSFYLILCASLVILFWPFLWTNIFANFAEVFKAAGRYSEQEFLPVLYLGKFISAGDLPWHYLFVWMLITIPLAYTLFFIAGFLSVASGFLRNFKERYAEKRLDLIFLCWFFVPVASVLIFKPVIYDGWRHLYFIYPAYLIISLAGAVFIWRQARRFWNFSAVRIMAVFLSALILVNVVSVSFFMVQNHPYQNLYFNFFIPNMAYAKKNFELDYWGLAYRRGLEYLAARERSDRIPVSFLTGAFEQTGILREKDRRRFFPVSPPSEEKVRYTKYAFTNYRGHPQEYEKKDLEREIFNIMIDGTRIMSVFQYDPQIHQK